MKHVFSEFIMVLAVFFFAAFLPQMALAGEHGGKEHGGSHMEGSRMAGMMHGSDAEVLLEAAEALAETHPDLAMRLEKIAKHS